MTEQPVDSQVDSVAQLMQSSAKPRCMEVEIAGGLYGLDVDDVKEVVALKPISRVFHAPPVIAGVVNLRGEVLTVIDPGVLLSETKSQRGVQARIVVLRDNSQHRVLAGLLVDRLGALREMPAAGLAPPPTTLPPDTARLITGVIADTPPCSVLDVPALFQSPELLELGQEPERER